ncbi:MAG TPA: 2-oxo-4-hydroxy-4-carboxy-5-ureidoimidazoline decarboxylase [Pyrinomonadaceae bacterium]
MTTRLDQLNTLSPAEAESEFLKCCGSQHWVQRMITNRPYLSVEELYLKAADLWWDLEQDDWLEAFSSHPKIGERKAATEVSTQAQEWSGQEQAGVEQAQEQTLSELARLNTEYEAKFGYIYIVCATGRSSEEMLEILKTRINNNAEDEITIAAGEQAKITDLRLRKMLA